MVSEKIEERFDKYSFAIGTYITSLLRLENFELIDKVPIYFIQGQLHCTPLLFLPCCRNSHRNNKESFVSGVSFKGNIIYSMFMRS